MFLLQPIGLKPQHGPLSSAPYLVMTLSVAIHILLLLLSISDGHAAPGEDSEDQAALQAIVDNTPPLPDFASFFEAIPPLGRRLRCAAPCTGIHGCGYALSTMQAPADTNNIFDLEDGYRNLLIQHLQEMGMDIANINLNLGPRAGDLLRISLQGLQLPVDLLVAGPPCPPWAGQGSHNHMKDPRAKVFMRLIEWIVFLAHCGGLLMVVIENVPGVLSSYGGLESAMNKFIRILKEAVPFFHWTWDILRLVDYYCPQTRIRAFLRGIRKVISSYVPPPLRPFGRRTLKEALGTFPHTPRASFSHQQQINIGVYEDRIRAMVNQRRLGLEDVVVIAPDRQDKRTYPQRMSVNVAPTFTTHNDDLLILSVADVVARVPDNERLFFRKFLASERLTIQGLPAKMLLKLGTTLTTKASGNAYPPPLIIAALQPLLMALSQSTLLLTAWPPPGLPNMPPPGILARVQRLLRARGRVVDKKKHQLQLQKRKRPAASSDSD